MNQLYVLQKLNYDRHRRFIAEQLGEHGGTTPRFSYAKTFDSEKAAESFRLVNNLTGFSVVLSDGTDDYETAVREYWEAKK